MLHLRRRRNAATPTTAGSTRTTRSRSPTTTTPPHGLPRLRVINEDASRRPGFGTHSAPGHGNRLYVLSGSSRTRTPSARRGDSRRRSAHDAGPASCTASSTHAAEPVHFLQIGSSPGERTCRRARQKAFARPRTGPAEPAGSSWSRRTGADGSITIHQDVRLFLARACGGMRARGPSPTRSRSGRKAPTCRSWRARSCSDGQPLEAGDGARIQGPGGAQRGSPAGPPRPWSSTCDRGEATMPASIRTCSASSGGCASSRSS